MPAQMGFNRRASRSRLSVTMANAETTTSTEDGSRPASFAPRCTCPRLRSNASDDAPLSIDDEAGAFAWNLAAGLSYDVMEHVTLSAGYRYLRLEGTDFSASLAGVDTGDVDVDDVTSHEILIGLRYTF